MLRITRVTSTCFKYKQFFLSLFNEPCLISSFDASWNEVDYESRWRLANYSAFKLRDKIAFLNEYHSHSVHSLVCVSTQVIILSTCAYRMSQDVCPFFKWRDYVNFNFTSRKPQLKHYNIGHCILTTCKL